MGWLDGVELHVFEGPNEYLYGEETAMLEAIDGRPPFPRIAPPYRRGVHDVVDRAVGVDSPSTSAALVELAGPSRDAVGSPALVNNVETLANVPTIMVEGPAWFRSVGTRESPGSLVCTVTGATRRHGVGEVPMGTPLQEVLRLIGEGPNPGRVIKAVMGGAATPLLTADHLDTPVSIEGMQRVGGRLGCAGFIVFDDRSDMAAVAEGVARFLSIESCGLCVPCKEDGMALAELFGRVRRSQANDRDLVAIKDRLRTVTNGARCDLATQYQLVLQSVLDDFADEIDAHVHGNRPLPLRSSLPPSSILMGPSRYSMSPIFASSRTGLSTPIGPESLRLTDSRTSDVHTWSERPHDRPSTIEVRSRRQSYHGNEGLPPALGARRL